MSTRRTAAPRNHGDSPFSVEASARVLDLLRESVPVAVDSPTSDAFGEAYDRQHNIAAVTYESQKAVRGRVKDFAVRCGFQIYVQNSSSKADGSGNAKYVCKKLNGQQYFDISTSEPDLVCPFYMNVYGVDGEWKMTRANFAHNHVKFVGTARRPCAEGTIARPVRDIRNTTQLEKRLVTMLTHEMLPAHDGSTGTFTGKAVASFLKGKGIDVSSSSISRIKCAIDDYIHGDRVESYQKLESYLVLVADKNPGSIWSLEKLADGVTFRRACVIPSVGIHVAHNSKLLFGFDGAHLKGEMNRHGVYLLATAKDYNKRTFPFGFPLVPVENYDDLM
jgi:hypothetical protein